MKKIFPLLITVFIFIPFSATAFTDLTADSPFFYALDDLEKRGLIKGYDDGTARPTQEINRAEALKIALSAFQAQSLNQVSETEITFPDVKKGVWYEPFVMVALNKKIISGYPDGFFRPEAGINTVEALKILLSSAGVKLNEKHKPPYADLEVGSWYEKYVSYAYAKHFWFSKADGLFHPSKFLTRGEFAEMTSRLLWSLEHEEKAFPLYLHWKSYQRFEHFYSLSVPFDWHVIEQQGSTIVWKQDYVSGQASFTRVARYSASLHIVLDGNSNKLTPKEYFDAVEKRLGTSFGKFKRFDLKGKFPSLRVDATQGDVMVSDLYVSLPNGMFLIFYTNYGQGDIQDELRTFIISVQHSFEFQEKGGIDISTLVEETRKIINVDKKGKEILDKYPDIELFETDSIGVGTGPIDYYFSAVANISIKYERSFDVILGVKEGKTSAF